ncbi:hypothetical protein DRQ15_09770 [candidate division KSB1 bacterium]|nr:MAG: hypothetical protein B5M50_04165 [candidate division KSB1 bacterium 4484_219]RKY76397.1 MAG: hypothetical protein DRQ12_10105 [candidate division KSB1 bacterium]RKY84608.1 MAG: hypothetical protein DRP98_04580 [candidate division KSB1 bacterium]RKY88626.1 MAG: hypothetical protein DRQ15_09770 [candidate division KSB1 bacterium]
MNLSGRLSQDFSRDDKYLMETQSMNEKKGKLKLILNPTSKPLKILVFLQQIIKQFNDEGYEVDVYRTQGNGDATEVARQTAISGEYETIIAAGGDGTVNEVINGIIGYSIKLGLLPLGTSNVLMRTLNLPLQPLKAAKLITQGYTHKIDVGKANGRYFALMISCGYDAFAIEQTSMLAKKIIGKYAYVWAGLTKLYCYKPHRISLKIDGKDYPKTGIFVAICNARSYGGNYQLCPEAKMDDGQLDILLVSSNSMMQLLYYAFRVILKLPLEYRDTIRPRAREIMLNASGRVPYQADGDIFGQLPVKVEVVPQAIEVIVAPPTN